MPAFASTSFASGNDPDQVVFLLITMDHNKKSQLNTQSKKNEPIFVSGVLWIKDQTGTFIQEYGRCFSEGNTVLFPVFRCFSIIPLERNVSH